MSSPAVSYVANFFTAEESKEIFNELVNAPYNNATYNSLRKMCAYADEDIYFNIPGINIQPRPWTEFLLNIKSKVEKELKCDFNYVLLSLFENGCARISPQKDIESSFDVDTPVTTISVGATRVMAFTKKGHSSVYYDLEPGSLLTVYNQQWKHSLPPQVNITEARISLTFRKIIPFVTNTSMPSYKPIKDDDDDVDGPESKKLCMPEHDWLHLHMTTIDLDETLKRFPIGNNVYVSVQMYQGKVLVHIRRFILDDSSQLIPTKEGICTSLETFFDACKKIPSISLAHATYSCIFNNYILALVVNKTTLKLQQLNQSGVNDNYIELNEGQLATLKNCREKITDFILNYLFCVRLPELICVRKSYNKKMDSSFEKLKCIVENHMLVHTNNHNNYGVNFSECIFLTSIRFMLLNLNDVVLEFLSCEDKISHKFDFSTLYK